MADDVDLGVFSKVYAVRYADGTWFVGRARHMWGGAGQYRRRSVERLADAKLMSAGRARSEVTHAIKEGLSVELVEFTIGPGVVLDESKRIEAVKYRLATRDEKRELSAAKRRLALAQKEAARAAEELAAAERAAKR